jgi:collagen type VII alpha
MAGHLSAPGHRLVSRLVGDQMSAPVGYPADADPVPPMLALRTRDCGRPGMELRLGSDDAPGNELTPGIELAEGRLGAAVPVGRLGSEGVDGKLGTELPDGRLGSEGAVGAVGADGTLGSEGRPGTDVGTPEGAVTQAVTPLPFDALTDPDPAGEVTLPPPDALAGLGIDGVAGVLTHSEPEGSECGTGSDVRLGTDVGATAPCSAPLGKAFAATAATAATPAAPAVSRIIRPKRGMFPLCVVGPSDVDGTVSGKRPVVTDLATNLYQRHKRPPQPAWQR